MRLCGYCLAVRDRVIHSVRDRVIHSSDSLK